MKIYYQVGNGAKRHGLASCSGRRGSISKAHEIPADQVDGFAPCMKCLPDEKAAPAAPKEIRSAAQKRIEDEGKIAWFKMNDTEWIGEHCTGDWQITKIKGGRYTLESFDTLDRTVLVFGKLIDAKNAAREIVKGFGK